MGQFKLEARLKFIARRFAEVGDVRTANAVLDETEKISALWRGSKPGDMLKDLQKIRTSLNALEAHLVLAAEPLSRTN